MRIQLHVYQLKHGQDGVSSLVEKAKWNKGYMLTAVAVTPDGNIAVADSLQSVTLLRLEGNTLECIARDFHRFWPFSIQSPAVNSLIVGEVRPLLPTFERRLIDHALAGVQRLSLQERRKSPGKNGRNVFWRTGK